MLYINKEMAASIENCVKQTHLAMTELNQGSCIEISGGAACFIGVDSYFSQVIGWGFLTKNFKQEIEIIEQFYRARNHSRVDIELCPLVGNALVSYLNQRGYLITELNNVSVLDLKTYSESKALFQIKQIKEDDLYLWSKIVAAGFEYPLAQSQFYQYATAKGNLAFGAYINGKLVAGATIAMHQDRCDLGVTSTLPAYRGRGLQKKLLAARLNFAKQLGLSIATVTTEPGSVSDVNVQKVGFRCAYTRLKLTLDFN